ncbi:MLV-related proviral Env polyprotein-like [Cervus elaphus]|uniref:MLV-related proviral Env polyprotein-like n=1 Tax=Cervus elaphus TaxID=9860 RepID=UPI001CC31F79|nr:MLV-related proviral Env polyprotein-like [Cervus elaphus]
MRDSLLWVTLGVLGVLEKGGHTYQNPHQPFQVTWILKNGETYEELNRTTATQPKDKWWPDLYFNLTKLIEQSGYSKCRVRSLGFYACPGHQRENIKTCGGMVSRYCKSWGCVTSNDGYRKWSVTRPDLINMSFTGPLPKSDWQGRPSNPGQCSDQIRLSFTQQGRTENRWISGLSWGVVIYDTYGTGSNSATLYVQQVLQPAQTQVMGPNQIITPPRPSPQGTNAANVVTLPTPTPSLQLTQTDPPETQEPLWALIKETYGALNHSNPNATQSCWLCYTSHPPYYEAVGLNATYNLSTLSNPPQCSWGDRKVGLTMKQVWGSGTCLGTVPTDKQTLCAQTDNDTNFTDKTYVIPEIGGWWICSRTGLTPCLHLAVFDQSREFCVMVVVVPKITYHPEEVLYNFWDQDTPAPRHKREPITAITLATLFALGAAGTGTGIASLTTQHQGLITLRVAIDEDIARIEKSMMALEKSLTSLSEVVLQNRRGLDLIFLQQGDLCAALKEECCFYADHTGVVRESMAKVREGLERRKREQEAQQGWFESWFQNSPWLTTLLSTLMGPLIILLLLLTFGPCLLNKLLAFVKQRLNTVQLMVLRQQYQGLPTDTL